MLAKRKSDGKIIEVKDWSGRCELYSDPDMNRFYQAEDLDFNVDAEGTVISGWVARDGNGNLWTYTHKPIRSENPYWLGEVADFTLTNDVLPDLTWESDPIEVEIRIKRKKK